MMLELYGKILQQAYNILKALFVVSLEIILNNSN